MVTFCLKQQSNTDKFHASRDYCMGLYHWLTAGDFLSESWLEGVFCWGGQGPRSAGPHELGPVSVKLCASWSKLLAASYCVFSSRVISLSSSSPNSPPISEGSPTTITSYNTNLESWEYGNVCSKKC